MDEVEADIVGLVELQTNWDKVHPRNRLPELLQGKVPLRTVQAHNKHDCGGTTFQQGGVAMVTVGALASKIMARGVDPMGLGHWCWQAYGSPGGTTRVVTAYQPVLQPDVTRVGASYQQQKWYWQIQGDLSCPCQAWKHDLLAQLREWKARGDSLILLADANEHTGRGELTQGLRAGELRMREVVWEWHEGCEVPATWHRGSDPIDGVWAMEDITPVAVMLLGSDKGVGDHRAIVLDVPDREICGYSVPRIQPLEACRLTGGIPLSQKNYVSCLRDPVLPPGDTGQGGPTRLGHLRPDDFGPESGDGEAGSHHGQGMVGSREGMQETPARGTPVLQTAKCGSEVHRSVAHGG